VGGRFECPECREACVDVAGFTDDARTRLRCLLCDHRWMHGGQAGKSTRAGSGSSHARPGPSAVPHGHDHQFAHEGPRFSVEGDLPATAPPSRGRCGPVLERYQRIFSAEGLPGADPDELKSFANTSTGAHPGNMSVFNKAWNEQGDAAASARLKRVLEYLLRGPAEVSVEDRLEQLIDPLDELGMTGFRESLLTKVLCIMEPTRFLPILTYTSPAGGKKESPRRS
jgi:hypothetical protein